MATCPPAQQSKKQPRENRWFTGLSAEGGLRPGMNAGPNTGCAGNARLESVRLSEEENQLA